jgi:hypothetical protein
MMALRKVIINTQTQEETWEDNTATDDLDLQQRQADAAAREAKQAAQQAAIDKLKANPDSDIQDLVKAMGW